MIEIIAHNYGADHANAIHNDAGAQQHGFAGALVPGVAVYGYLIRPAVNLWGLDWLTRGAASVRFLHPVYDGERMIAEADGVMNLQLRNGAQTICATGSAALPAELPLFSAMDYELAETRLRPPAIASFQIGEPLGSLSFTLRWQEERAAFLADMNDSDALYGQLDWVVEQDGILFRDQRNKIPSCSTDQCALHPAYWLARANEVFMNNIALGMWIHTASEIQHYALAAEGEAISVRGRVVALYEKKGHEYLVAKLAAFGEAARPLVQIKHTAIIRLRGE